MKMWEKFSEDADENEMIASLFCNMAREKLETYCEVYHPDFAERIDWDKGYKLLDEEMETFLTPKYRRKDAFALLFEATKNTGLRSRFLFHMVFVTQIELIKVGVMEVPEGAKQAVDPADLKMKEILGLGEYGQMVMGMLRMSRAMRKNKDAVKPLDDTPNCSGCGRSDLPLTITINVTAMETSKLCSVCLSKRRSNPKKRVDIKKIDKEIEKLEKLAKEYEQLIAEHPEESGVSKELSPYAMTPLSNYKSVQALIAEARADRLAALSSMQGETRLNYELKKAVAAEDYEKSAKLRDKLRKISK